MGFLDRLRIGATGGLLASALYLISRIQQFGMDQAGATIAHDMFGVQVNDGSWDLKRMIPFWMPIAVGGTASIVASKTGINSKLPKGIKI